MLVSKVVFATVFVAVQLMNALGQAANRSLSGGHAAAAGPFEQSTMSWFHGAKTSSNVAWNPVRIGTTVSSAATGSYVYSNSQISTGYKLFFQMLNTHVGGIKVNGIVRPVELVVIEDYSNSSILKYDYETMIRDQGIELFLATPTYKAAIREAAHVVAKHEVLLMSPFDDNDAIYRHRPLVFGVQQQRKKFFRDILMTLRDQGAWSVAQFTIGDPWSRGLCNSVRNIVVDLGMIFVGGEAVSPNPSDKEVRDKVQRLKAENPNLDVLLFCSPAPPQCRKLLNQLKAQDYNIKAIITTRCPVDPVRQPPFLRPLTPNVLTTDIWTAGDNMRDTVLGISRATFMSEFGRFTQGLMEGGSHAAAAFGTAATLVWAIQNASSTHPRKIAKSLHKIDVDTVFGHVSFDEHGMNNNNIDIQQYDFAGRGSVVSPSDRRTGMIVYPKPPWVTGKCMDIKNLQATHYGFDGHGHCVLCQDGWVGAIQGSKRVCTKCRPGQFYGDPKDGSDNVYCVSCSAGTFSDGRARTSCSVCKPGTITNASGQSACSICPRGTYSATSGGSTCKDCKSVPNNKVMYADQPGSARCSYCPEGAVCLEDANGMRTNYTNADGHWKLDVHDTSGLHKCIHGAGKACLQDGQCYRDEETGQPAMEGLMCSRCKDGYGRIDENSLCYKCPSVWEGILWLLAIVLQLCFSATIMVKVTLSRNPSRPKLLVAIVLKQVFNYCSICSVIFTVVEIKMPVIGNALLDTMNFMRVFFGGSSPSHWQLSIDCLVRRAFPSFPTYQFYSWAGIAWVPAWELFVVMAYLFLNCRLRSRGKQPISRETLVCAMVVNVFIVYPRASDLIMAPFRCKFFDVGRLRYDLDMDCNSDEMAFMRLQALVGCVLISLGCPFALYMYLRRYYKKEMLHDADVDTMMGFMYHGFELNYYYYECVVMIRKLSFQLVLIVPGLGALDGHTDLAIKACTMQVLATLYLALHLTCRPFDNRYHSLLDKIESAGLWAIFVTLFLATWRYVTEEAYAFSGSKRSETYKAARDWVCPFLLVVVHVRFWLFVIRGMCTTPATLKFMRERCPCTRRLTHSGAVQIRENGFKLIGCSPEEEDGFKILLADVVGYMFEDGDPEGSNFIYERLISALQQVAIQAAHNDERTMQEANLHRKLEFVAKKSQTIKSAWRSLVQSSAKKVTSSAHVQRPDIVKVPSKNSVSSLATLSALNLENLEATYCMSFTVDELYAAALELHQSINDNPRAMNWCDLSHKSKLERQANEELQRETKRLRDEEFAELQGKFEAECARADAETARADREADAAREANERADESADLVKDLKHELKGTNNRIRFLEKELRRLSAKLSSGSEPLQTPPGAPTNAAEFVPIEETDGVLTRLLPSSEDETSNDRSASSASQNARQPLREVPAIPSLELQRLVQGPRTPRDVAMDFNRSRDQNEARDGAVKELVCPRCTGSEARDGAVKQLVCPRCKADLIYSETMKLEEELRFARESSQSWQNKFELLQRFVQESGVGVPDHPQMSFKPNFHSDPYRLADTDDRHVATQLMPGAIDRIYAHPSHAYTGPRFDGMFGPAQKTPRGLSEFSGWMANQWDSSQDQATSAQSEPKVLMQL